MNDVNTDNHAHEIESNNRVIKERFRIVYYRFPYKEIPRINIRHLEMNVIQNLNLFPAKKGVSAQYTPYMILSQRNWYYNKHPQVEFGAYVQASQFNAPTNKNRPRALDGICLFLSTNFQGGHHIMYPRARKLITRPKVVEIPIIYVLTNAFEKWRRSRNLVHYSFIQPWGVCLEEKILLSAFVCSFVRCLP